MSWVITVDRDGLSLHTWAGDDIWLPTGDGDLSMGKKFAIREEAVAEAIGLKMRDDMSALLRGEMTITELKS